MEDRLSVIDSTILKGVRYLHQHQYPNGEFCSYIGSEDHLKDCIAHSHVFPTSLICYSLLGLRDIPEAEEILQLSASFLQFQCMRSGVWNQYTSWSTWFPAFPCDVDNTSCASIVLRALNRPYTENRQMLCYNRSKNGLFYTWYTFRPQLILNKDYWLLALRAFRNPIIAYHFWTKNEATRYDIDGAVNANVLLYLGLNEDTAAIIPYLLNIIATESEADCDLWYRNPLVVYYFISRNYSAGVKELEPSKLPMTERILSLVRADGSIGDSALDTAMGIISLIHLDHDSPVLDAAVQALVRSQNTYGEWPRWSIYYDGREKLQCFGSEEITTGYCLEALSRYKSQLSKRYETI